MKKTLPIFLSLCLSLSFQPNISIFANEVNNNISTTAETSTVNFGELASSAKFYKNFEKDAQLGGTTFDGTRVVDYSNELANISSLKEGSVLMKIKPDPSTSDTQILYAGDEARFIFNAAKGPGKLRYEFKSGMISNSDGLINDNQYHNIIYTADEVAVGGSTDVRLSIDGVTDKGYTSNGKYQGFFGYNNSKTLKVGGAEGLNGFKGEIAYIMITDKVLTQDEMNALTAPEVVPTPPTFEELVSSAKFYKNFKSDSSLGGNYFDGSRVEDYTSEVTNISTLQEGTIMMKVKLDSSSTNNDRYMFNAMSTENGITQRQDAFFYYSKSNTCFRYSFYNGMMSNTSTSLKDDMYHKIVYTAQKAPNGKTYVRVSIDGLTTNDWGASTYDGFFGQSPSPINRLTVGGTDSSAATNFVGNIDYIMVTDKVLTMNEMKQLSTPDEEDIVKRDDLLFYPGDATGSEYFRIPSLYTTSKGTVVASIDARFGGGADSPNNLDTTVRRSTDGGNTWEDAFLTNHFVDYPDVSGGKSGSASFIDPVMFEDETNGRLFMVVDAFPTGGGIFGECEAGSAFDNNGNLKLRFKSATTYDYIAVKKTNGTGYDVKTTSGENTEYTLNGKLEVLKNGTALTVPQADTNIQVPMNVFYANSDLRVLGTSYLYLTHSDDDGLTWSNPIILDGMTYTDTNGQKQQIKDPSMRFLGVGPGRGIQLKNGKHKGRLLFPAYQFIHNTPGSSQRSALVYSDDGGNTWARSELVDTSTLGSGAYMSEAVPVELPDGSILLLGRTNTGKIGQVVSTDGGATWQGAVTLVDEIPSNDCQISAINYSNPIDGKPAIIVSSPQHPGRRIGGVIDIGLISENGTYDDGSKKYSIEWKYKFNINNTSTPYKYSCLTELPDGDVMVLYESTGDSEIPFTTFSIDEIVNQSPEVIFSDTNITSPKQISNDDFNKIKSLDQSTIIVKFKENTTSNTAPLIGLSDAQNNGFYIYSTGDSVGYRFVNGINDISYKSPDKNLNNKEINTIAFKANKREGDYKVFANGEFVSSKTPVKYEFLNKISTLDTGYLSKFEGQSNYTFDGTIESIEIYNRALSDDKLIEITGKTPIIIPPQRNDKIFYSGDATNSNYFRIPAILTTKAGTTIAAIDARFGGTPDSPNNLDTAVRRSTDDGATWDVATLPNHFIDYPDREGYQGKSASFIDAVMLENEDGRVFMLVDAFPAGAGLMGGHCETGSGYAPKGNGSTDPTLYLKMQWGNETNYNNRAIPNGNGTYTIYNAQGTTPTTYTMNAKFELFNNGQPLMMEQQETGKQIPMNAFYDGATFYLQKTSYLYLTYSDDQGLTWSDPIILNNMVKDDNMTFLGTGPGRGIQLKNGEYAGRLLFPVYQYEYNTSLSGNAQRSALIYSDDNGVTWTRGDFVELSEGFGAMSESVPIELPDGSIILFGRTDGGKVGQAISTDGGATWTAPVTLNEISAPYSQLTAINYSKLIDGKPAIILASASHPSNRVSGVINIGLVNDDNTIEWKYKAPINGEGEAYGYSCITELTNGDILVFYEGSDASTIPHKVMTIDEIKNSTGGDTEKTEIVNNNKDLDYTITKEATATESGEVSVKVINKNTKSVTIPSTVLDNKNRKYNVAILEDNAFESCSSLIDLTLPKTIKTIKNSMFSGCTNLSLLTILSETLNIADNLSNLPADTKFIVKTSAIKDALVAKGINVDNILLDDGQSEVELQKAIEEAKAVLKDDNAPVNNILKSIKNLSDAIIENNQKQ